MYTVNTKASHSQGNHPLIAGFSPELDLKLLDAIERLNNAIDSNPMNVWEAEESICKVTKDCDFNRVALSTKKWLLGTFDRMRHHPDEELARNVKQGIVETVAPLRAELIAGTLPPDRLLKIIEGFSPSAHAPTPFFEADVFFDYLLGLEDPRQPAGASQRLMQPNIPTRATHLPQLVKEAQLSRNDVFIDIGSGSGRVVMAMALLTPASIKGIEIDAEVAELSKNTIKENRLDRAEIINVDARTADLSKGTVFFLNAPFFGEIMDSVLERLDQIASKKDDIRIILHGTLDRKDFESANLVPENDVMSLFHHLRSRRATR